MSRVSTSVGVGPPVTVTVKWKSVLVVPLVGETEPLKTVEPHEKAAAVTGVRTRASRHAPIAIDAARRNPWLMVDRRKLSHYWNGDPNVAHRDRVRPRVVRLDGRVLSSWPDGRGPSIHVAILATLRRPGRSPARNRDLG